MNELYEFPTVYPKILMFYPKSRSLSMYNLNLLRGGMFVLGHRVEPLASFDLMPSPNILLACRMMQ